MSLSNNYPAIATTLLQDFVKSRVFDPRITFTRASTATYFNSLGVLTTANNNVPRLDYNPSTLAAQGLLIEEARTNSIRNNTGVGAVAGTPGTPPTDWFGAAPTGITRSIVGTGTENGITYIDFRFNGTATAAGALQIGFATANQISATVGQTFAQSLYWKLAAGSTANLTSQRIFNNEYSSTPTYLRSNVQLTSFPTSAGLATQRVSFASTMQDATCAFVQPCLGADVANGAAIDITLRIGLPQLEQGAFATSVIPTTTTALTRNADVASMTGTNFSSWYNQTEGTFVAQALSVWASGNVVGSSDGTNNNRIFVGTASGPNGRLLITTSAVTQASITSAYSLSTTAKFAGAYKLNSSNFALNAALGTEDTACTIPTVDRLSIGTNTTLSDFFLNGYIQRITYYPTRNTNSQLQALTGS